MRRTLEFVAHSSPTRTSSPQIVQNGMDPTAPTFGHSSIGITLDVYSHVLPGMQEDAAQKIDTALREAMDRS